MVSCMCLKTASHVAMSDVAEPLCYIMAAWHIVKSV